MENVKLEDYGSGWKWYATVRKGRAPFNDARDEAVRIYGPDKVRRAETVAMIRDRQVQAYAAEQCACRECFGFSLGSWDLLETPEIRAERYAAYVTAADKCNVTLFANLPPNYKLIIDMAAGDKASRERYEQSGQLGFGPDNDVAMTGFPVVGRHKSTV